jgi:amino acid adenylation domain-containing protein
MKAAVLLRRIIDLGVQVWREDDQIRVRMPKGSLPSESREQLKAQKQEVLALLRPGARYAPVTSQQVRLWFIERFAPGASTYNIPSTLRVNGAMSQEALQKAFHAVGRRHDILRTLLTTLDGRPVQTILDEMHAEPLCRTARDESEAMALAARLAREPFSLEMGPLLRLHLITYAPERHLLLLVVHHTAADLWSLSVFWSELWRFYDALLRGIEREETALPLQYADYACQGAARRNGLDDEKTAYWTRRLHTPLPTLELPRDFARPAVQAFEGHEFDLVLPKPLLAKMKSLAEGSDVTLFVVAMAGYFALLNRYTGQTDLIVGTPVAGRSQAGTDELIGFFANTLPIRATVQGNMTFRDLIRDVRTAVLDMQAYQDVSFERVVESLQLERSTDTSPVFQTIMAFQSVYRNVDTPAGIEIDHVFTPLGRSRFDLSLFVREIEEGLRFRFEYSTCLFREATMRRFAGHLESLLGHLCAAPDEPLDLSPLLTESEETQVVQTFNATAADYPRDASLSELFERQAAARPEAPALVSAHTGAATGYRELDTWANGIAHALQARGARPEGMIGLCIERGSAAVAATLGIVKSGAAYLPLDPAYPRERLQWMLRDAGCTLVVTEVRYKDLVQACGAEALCLDAGEPLRADAPPHVKTSGDSAAYVMYTSGSTGLPKGVCVTHRNVVRLLLNTNYVHLGPEETLLQFAPMSFDAATFEIWGALLHGARLVVCDVERPSLRELGDIVRRRGVTTLWLTAGLFHPMIDHELESLRGLRQLLAGGDVLSPDHVRRALAGLPGCTLINGYGPTECTTFSCCHPMREGEDVGETVPIGRPIANTTTYVLDPRLRPVPIGVEGELYIGGDGVAQGYLNRPELTAERFLENPFGAGRLYKTGDRVRWREDGRIEFLGRADFQVKIRGYRVELGEIEAALEQHPELRQAVVVARADESGDKTLLAYAVFNNGALDPQELKSWLQGRLPLHMVPSAIITLDSLPLNANGKVDRKALPTPQREDFGAPASAPEPPQTETERRVAKIFTEVLELPAMGRRDDFFQMGGHSLSATQAVTRIAETLGVSVSLPEFFDNHTPYLLGRLIDAKSPQTEEVRSMDKSADVTLQKKKAHLRELLKKRGSNLRLYPLSFAQQRLWFLHQFTPDSPAYNIPTVMKAQGRLDREALRWSFQQIVIRHDVLRTTFLVKDSDPVQVVADESALVFEEIDLSRLSPERRNAEANRLVARWRNAPFNLAQDSLLRVILLKMAEEEHIMLTCIHHIVSDGWSMGVLTRELGEFYEAHVTHREPRLSPLPIRYGDFAVWQRAHLQGDVLERQLSYWRERLDGLQTLHLPTDRPRPPLQDFVGDRLELFLPSDLSASLRALNHREGSTLFMTLLAGFCVVLHRYTGQSDLAVATAIANRSRKELEDLVGFFVNTLVMRTRLGDNPTFLELIQRVRENAVGAYDHQDVPFERLVEELQPERDMSRNPLVQVMFVVQNTPRKKLVLPGVVLSAVEMEEVTTRFDLEFHVWEENEDLKCIVYYSTTLFERRRIERMYEHWITMLRWAVRNPQRLISEAPLLTESEETQVVQTFNATAADYPRDASLSELFERQAAARPEAPALVSAHTGAATGYRELDTWANGIAHALQARGARPEGMIGLCIERGSAAVAATLGIVKSGAAYLPLDPAYPRERLQWMLRDAGCTLVVTEVRYKDLVQACGAEALCLDAGEPLRADAPPHVKTSGDSAAYVMYTSGSTGLPKGVCVTHRNVVRLLLNTNYVHLGPEETLLQFAPMSFDAATFEIWGALLHGARLVVCDVERPSLRELGDIVRRRGVTTLWLTAGLFHPMIDHELESLRGLRQLLAGGDVLSPDHVRRALAGLPGCTLINGYGPTECTTFSCCHPMREGEDVGETVPIGRPIANTTTYVLDPRLRPVPIGVEGELYIGGDGVAQGYLNRPELTAERFLENPFGAGRLYKTGDRVRWREDGRIEFLGRSDFQVKIRGYRVELGEIEAALEQHPDLRQAVVVAQERADGDKHLAAYVSPREDYLDGVGDTAEQVGAWESLYDETYAEQQDQAVSEDNFHGWNSSYTDLPIPLEEMREWVQATTGRVREEKASRIWEVGCGAGLLLGRLAPDCAEYWGTDFSARVLEHAGRLVASRKDLRHVRLDRRRADDFSGVKPQSFDAVILNSVVQYFPSVNYLVRVLEGAVAATAPGGRVILGDLRSLPLHESYAASVSLYRAHRDTSRQEFAEMVRRMLMREEELLVAPGLFHRLRSVLPAITGVTVTPKRSRFQNELSRFRYEVTLHVGASTKPAPRPLWQDWDRAEMTPEQLKNLLRTTTDKSVGLRRVPNARLAQENQALRWMRASADAEEAEIVGTLRDRPQQSGIDPDALCLLADGLGWRATLDWSQPGSEGTFDAAFVRAGVEGEVDFEVAVSEAPFREFANTPNRMAAEQSLKEALRDYLTERLPSHMVPGAFVVLQEFPLTENGKIDRKALPSPELRVGEDIALSAPETETEHRLATLFEKVLGISRVGVDESFFNLGGHSLLATQLASRARKTFGVDVPLRDVFELNTVRRLAARIDTALVVQAPPMAPVDRSVPLPLSFAQQRLWFIEQLAPGTPAYNMPLALRMKGVLNVGALERALSTLVRRHESLRTRFEAVGGQAHQVVQPSVPITFELTNLSGIPAEEHRAKALAIMTADALEPFNLQTGPVFRAQLVRLAAEDHLLVLCMHHIVSDGWSTGILVAEMGACYDAYVAGVEPELPPLTIQYPDFAVWQRQWMRGAVMDAQRAYWSKRLSGIQPLQLPLDYPRPPVQQFRGAIESCRIPVKVCAALRAIGAREGTTLFMTLMASFKALVHRYVGADDVAVGSAIANRNHLEIEPLIGFFVNTLVLRTDLSGDPTFLELLSRVQETTLGAYEHQDMPFEQLVEELQPERDMSRNPLVQVVFVLQNAPTREWKLKGLDVAWMGAGETTTRFDLEFHLWEKEDELDCLIFFNTSLFKRERVQHLFRHWMNVLEAVVDNPALPVSELPVLDEEERERLLTLGRGLERTWTDARGVAEPVAEWAARTPEAIAVSGNGLALSYAELERRAGAFAAQLAARGARGGDIVALLMDRSPELAIAELGALKAGCAYLPMDLGAPRKRQEYIIADSGVKLVATTADRAGQIAECGSEALVVDARAEVSGTVEPTSAAAGDIAYVIYTSGSTGQPKGVRVPHAALTNLVNWHIEAFGVTPSSRATLVANPAFDASVWELWPYLAAGATVCIPDEALRNDPRSLAAWYAAEAITIGFVPTPLAEALFRVPWPAETKLQYLLTGGDRLTQHAPASLPCRLVNNYGPTENAVVTTSIVLDTADTDAASPPSIGRPIANNAVCLLDRYGNLSPWGVPGELCIGGASLAHGYLNRPELTRERFVNNPFGEGLLYRTGDLAVFREDGTLDFLGRIDEQVKVRGYRIELGEIEATVLQHPAVREAAAMAREDSVDGKRLVAYVTVDAERMRDEARTAEEESAHVSRWQSLYETTYGGDASEFDPKTNIIGWNSSYTGEPIPAAEMREWADAAAQRVLALKPSRVLEIGCGTGMLLFRIAPHCTAYEGWDFSQTAIDFVQRAMASDNGDWSHVSLRRRLADDISDAAPGSFDCVVLNSIVQYFPGIDYLLRVLDGAMTLLAPGGRIVLGDIRSLALLDAYAAEVELACAPDGTSPEDFLRRVRERVQLEEELTIDPTFFSALKHRYPRIADVSVAPKTDGYVNELTQFRYEAIIETKGAEDSGNGAHTASPVWMDWERDELTPAAVEAWLTEHPGETLAIRHIANARLARPMQALDWAHSDAEADRPVALSELRGRIVEEGVSPSDLAALASRSGRTLRLDWSTQARRGTFAALFAPPDAPRMHLGEQVSHPRTWASYANNPLQAEWSREFAPRLRAFLEERLPEYMVPSAFVILDAFPLTPNGKLDRRALPAPGRTRGEEGTYVAPATESEERIAAIFGDLLNVDHVGAEDSFFNLGGHSLLATQLASRIEAAFSTRITIQAIFQSPTVRGLARTADMSPRESGLSASEPAIARAPSLEDDLLGLVDNMTEEQLDALLREMDGASPHSSPPRERLGP